MSYLHRTDRFYKFRIEGFTFSTNGINNPYQFIHKSNHCLLITAKLSPLAKEVFSKVRVPFNHTCSHLKQDSSKRSTSLFGYTHSELILSRLFYHWVCACILYELFVIGEVLYILNLSKEKTCESFRDTFYRGEEFHLIVLLFVYLINKHLLKSLNLWLKEEEFFNIEDKHFSVVRVINTDRVFSELDEVLWLKRGFSAFSRGIFDYSSNVFMFSLFDVFS